METLIKRANHSMVIGGGKGEEGRNIITGGRRGNKEGEKDEKKGE